MSYIKYLQNEIQSTLFMVMFVFSTPKFYRLGPFKVSYNFAVDQCNRLLSLI